MRYSVFVTVMIVTTLRSLMSLLELNVSLLNVKKDVLNAESTVPES